MPLEISRWGYVLADFRGRAPPFAPRADSRPPTAHLGILCHRVPLWRGKVVVARLDLLVELVLLLIPKWRVSGQQDVEDHAARPDVDLGIVGHASAYLGGKIARGPGKACWKGKCGGMLSSAVVCPAGEGAHVAQLRTEIGGPVLHDDGQAKVCDLDGRIALMRGKEQVLGLTREREQKRR
jgi:hypothetical protein